MHELPLLLFTFLSGISVGTFIFYTIMNLFFPTQISSANTVKNEKTGISAFIAPLSAKISILSIVLLGCSLLASATHLGHPFRFLNAFSNPKSMIAQEAYWSIAFGVLLLITLIQIFKGKEPSILLNGLTSLVGAGLLIVTSLVYANVMGMPAWNHGVTPILFFFSAIIMGCVVYLLLTASQPNNQEMMKKVFAILIGLVVIQIAVVAAFTLQVSSITNTVQLPDLFPLHIIRWIIGLALPLLIAAAVLKKSVKIQLGATLLFFTIIIGEGLSRIIFFMNGIHL